MISIKYLLSLNRYSRNGKKNNEPRGIILHHSDNDGYTAIEMRNYFENLKTGKNAIYCSTHYIVGFDGEVINCVPEEEVAYHRGNSEESNGNISIMCCSYDKNCELGRNSRQALKALVRKITEKYNFDVQKDFQRHYDVSGIKCPLFYTMHDNKWRELKTEINNEIEIVRNIRKDTNEIAEKLSGILKIDIRYAKELLEEKANADIVTISKMSDLEIEK